MWSSPAGTRARLMQQVGRLMSNVILLLMVGLLVLSVSAAAKSKEPRAEELDAAAQTCREDSMWSSPAGTRARLMQQVGRWMSIVILLLMVGLVVLSVFPNEVNAEVAAPVSGRRWEPPRGGE